MNKREFILYMRNFILGAEDSLVSTVSMLSGIYAAGVSHRAIIVSGVVLISVEAFSMSVGSFLSEKTAEESSPSPDKEKSKSFSASAVMFFSYFISGIFPLTPYVIFSNAYSFWGSIIVSFIALWLLGAFSAEVLKTNVIKSSLRMVLLGGLAIVLGIVVGYFIR